MDRTRQNRVYYTSKQIVLERVYVDGGGFGWQFHCLLLGWNYLDGS